VSPGCWSQAWWCFIIIPPGTTPLLLTLKRFRSKGPVPTNSKKMKHGSA